MRRLMRNVLCSKALTGDEQKMLHAGDQHRPPPPNTHKTMSYADLELKVIQWAEARQIVQHSNNMAQAIKTLEEVTELLDAIQRGDKVAQKDAYGDILVTLIVGCATADFDLCDCLAGAYKEIKDRRGYLTAQGVFVKE